MATAAVAGDQSHHAGRPVGSSRLSVRRAPPTAAESPEPTARRAPPCASCTGGRRRGWRGAIHDAARVAGRAGRGVGGSRRSLTTRGRGSGSQQERTRDDPRRADRPGAAPRRCPPAARALSRVPADEAFGAALGLDALRHPLVRALVAARALPLGATGPRTLRIADLTGPPFGRSVPAERADTELVLAPLARPWRLGAPPPAHRPRRSPPPTQLNPWPPDLPRCPSSR